MGSAVKLFRESLTLFVAVLFILSLATNAWQRMYFMETSSDGVIKKRLDGYFHDFFQDVGLVVMQLNPCKEGKSLPDNDGDRYGGKTCSFSISTHYTLEETSLKYRYEAISDLLIGSETECYKGHVEDTRALSDRFARLVEGFSICAWVGYVVVFLMVVLSLMNIFHSRFAKGIIPMIVLLTAFVFSLGILITTAALPPSSKYTVCTKKDNLEILDYTDVFTPGWSWYVYLVGVLLTPGIIFLEYKSKKTATVEE
eukprot:TRINITY_DN80486_c0_g1_i1.p1 TRINITY_DN80486_c0_g1~~TRINITY_DN80486_c0_g1_i1.p1  ORF type:complete len:255 (-),score=39.22 TRINITY_DN80486_c0_g1_i1:228-992(-)